MVITGTIDDYIMKMQETKEDSIANVTEGETRNIPALKQLLALIGNGDAKLDHSFARFVVDDDYDDEPELER